MHKAVFCITKSQEQAEEIVERLQSAGFSTDDISVLFVDSNAKKEFTQERLADTPEGAASGAASGAMAGAVLGSLTGMGAPALPGLEPFIVAGRAMATLSGAALGGMIGGMTGAFTGLGVPEDEARRYERRIKDGSVLISVHSENSDDAERARAILEDASAEDISYAEEATVAG